VKQLLEELGLYEDRNKLSGGLPFGQRKLLELLRVIVSKPKCVLLDELITGLTEEERALVVKEIKRMVSTGTRIVLVEHNIEFTMNICEQIYVLDHGCLIAEGSPPEISSNKKVIDVYLGA
jgi:branched-chain amino acid transport system ATP-binding protein